MPNKNRSRAQAARERRAIKKLQRVGLVSDKVDLRKKPSKHILNKLKRFADVVKGKATVVKAPSPKAASRYKVKGFVVVKEKIIVKKERGERLRYQKRSGEIVSSKKVKGGRVRKRISPKFVEKRAVPLGPNNYYVLPLMRGRHAERFRFKTWEELENFIYSGTLGRSFPKWADYVEVETFEGDEEPDEYEDEGEL